MGEGNLAGSSVEEVFVLLHLLYSIVVKVIVYHEVYC